MSLEISGQIIEILPEQSGVSKAGKEWTKQEFVIETQEQFPRKVCFTLFGDKVSLISGISVGDNVNVAFNLESREFNGKWFHNINAWKLEKTSVEENLPEPPPEFRAEDIPPEPADDAGNDLPF